MAIIQISQIKHRRGLRADLPFSLEEGEIGLTLDTGELFIGTPNLPQAIQRAKASSASFFPFKNTQILTEWTDNIKNTLNYRYRYRSVEFNDVSARYIYNNDLADTSLSFTNSSGNSILFTVSRKLQEKLDDTVSVRDYGSLGNGVKDFSIIPSNVEMEIETKSLRKAILDISNGAKNESIKGEWKPRSLFFPAGVYCINDSLFLPSNSYWYGEGKGNTIIAFCSSPNINITKGFNDCLLFTVSDSAKPTDITNSSIQNFAYQNINKPVSNIFIRDISFIIQKDRVKTGNNTPIDIIRLIRGKNILFYNCEFIGNWSNVVEGSASSNYEIKATSNSVYYYPGDNINVGDNIGVIVDSGGSIDENFKPLDVYFINCDFKNTTYASLITDDVSNINFINCTFNRHFRGLSFSETLVSPTSFLTTGNRGPRNINIQSNIFRNIKAEAIFVGSNTLSSLPTDDNSFTTEFFYKGNINSFFNLFENVGNNNTNFGLEYTSNILSANPTYYVINFSSGVSNCASIGDSFSRKYILEKINGTYGSTIERINFNPKNQNIIINNKDFFVNNVREIILSANTSGYTGLSFNVNAIDSIFINYTLNFKETNIKRIGDIKLISTSSFPLIDETYSETSLSNLIFNVMISSNNIKLIYENNNSSNAVFSYEFKYWKS